MKSGVESPGKGDKSVPVILVAPESNGERGDQSEGIDKC